MGSLTAFSICCGRYRFDCAPIIAVLKEISQRDPGIEIDPALPEYDRKVLATFGA